MTPGEGSRSSQQMPVDSPPRSLLIRMEALPEGLLLLGLLPPLRPCLLGASLLLGLPGAPLGLPGLLSRRVPASAIREPCRERLLAGGRSADPCFHRYLPPLPLQATGSGSSGSQPPERSGSRPSMRSWGSGRLSGSSTRRGTSSVRGGSSRSANRLSRSASASLRSPPGGGPPPPEGR